jgi:PAS domain S-box-containing protein
LVTVSDVSRFSIPSNKNHRTGTNFQCYEATGTSPIASPAFSNVTSPSMLQTPAGALPLINVAQGSAAQHLPVNTIGFTHQMPQPAVPTSLATIAPQPQKHNSSNAGTDWSDDDNLDESEYCTGDKRQIKRVANRKSAQLSRKRKKQFIEELKEENDGLRRKEQILRSIPDLVVVFDSSGKLWFVSESVSKFLDFTADELEGTSFWNRLCDDSVRLLKAAFMDSLAARQQDAETASLGSGIWELRLVDKDGNRKVVTLHGVVHFAGERPECVCSIRPLDDTTTTTTMVHRNDTGARHDSFISVSTSSVASCSNSLKRHRKTSVHVNPNQSVVSCSDNNERHHLSDTLSSSTIRGSNNRAVRISDSGNSSGSSDSGSGDELNNTEITA